MRKGFKNWIAEILLKKGRQTGFTLVELMLAAAMVATLAAMAVPQYIQYRYHADVSNAIADIRNLEPEIFMYKYTHMHLPDSLADVGLGGLRDPWGNPYRYLRIDGGSVKGKGKFRKDHGMVPVNSDFDLYSMGRDGNSKGPFTAKASRDDIVRAQDGAYVGLVSNY